MKALILILAFTLGSTAVAAEDVPSIQRMIVNNEAALGRAMIARDTATLSRLVGEDWTIQNDSGTPGTRAAFIHDIGSGKLVVNRFVLHDLHVRVSGDVAWLFGTDDEVSSYDGKESNGRYNWLDVWVKRNGHWVSVATQLTRVKAAG